MYYNKGLASKLDFKLIPIVYNVENIVLRTKLYHTEKRISSDSYSNSIQNFVTIFFAKEDEAEQDQFRVLFGNPPASEASRGVY